LGWIITLHPHIEMHHHKLYLSLVKANSWKVLLPGLVSQAQSQATSVASASQVGPLVEIDKQKFHQHLLYFIIADDQVRLHFLSFLHSLHSCLLVLNPKSLNIIECPEFRKLLLFLRSNLRESLIPHRTKLHKLVIQAWRQHFKVLRHDLAVHLPQHLSYLFSFFFDPGHYGADFLYIGYMVQSTLQIFSGSHCPLGCECRRNLSFTAQDSTHCLSPPPPEPHWQIYGENSHAPS